MVFRKPLIRQKFFCLNRWSAIVYRYVRVAYFNRSLLQEDLLVDFVHDRQELSKLQKQKRIGLQEMCSFHIQSFLGL